MYGSSKHQLIIEICWTADWSKTTEYNEIDKIWKIIEKVLTKTAETVKKPAGRMTNNKEEIRMEYAECWKETRKLIRAKGSILIEERKGYFKELLKGKQEKSYKRRIQKVLNNLKN